MSNENELLPCPHCRDMAVEHGITNMVGSQWRAVTCAGCQARTGLFKTSAEAIAAWNARRPILSDEAVERAARVIYDADPFYEPPEYADAFPVSPGHTLTWEQACTRDAEFASVPIMLPVTKSARDLARAVLAAAFSPPPEPAPSVEAGWQPIDTAPKDGTHVLVCFGEVSPIHAPTVAHWFEPTPSPGPMAGGWYLSVQQNEGPAVLPTHWQPVQPLPAAPAHREVGE